MEILLTIVFALILITQLVVIKRLRNHPTRILKMDFDKLKKQLHNMETNRNYYKRKYLAFKK